MLSQNLNNIAHKLNRITGWYVLDDYAGFILDMDDVSDDAQELAITLAEKIAIETHNQPVSSYGLVNLLTMEAKRIELAQ